MKSKIVVALSLLVCAAAVRLEGIWSHFYSPDELMNLSISQGRTLFEVLHRSKQEVHPPFEQIFKWFVLLATDNLVALRVIYCAIGVTAIIALGSAAYVVGGASAGVTCIALAIFAPASVSSSVLVRGYGLWLLFTALALREFFLVFQSEPRLRQRRLIWLTIWLVLSCATHFAGFLLAGGIIATLLSLHLSSRERERVGLFSVMVMISVLAVEGAAFYWWYFSPGTGAHAWRLLSHHALFNGCSDFTSPSFALARILTLFMPLPLTNSSINLLVGSSAALAAWYIIGLYRIASRYPTITYYVLIQWTVAIIANFMGIFPLAGPRHALYLLPAILIPFSLLIGPTLFRWPLSGITVIALLAFGVVRNAHFEASQDFPLRTENYEEAKEYLRTEASPQDVILTSRFGLLYMLYEADNLRTFYLPQEPVFESSFVGVNSLASTHDRLWQVTRNELPVWLSAARAKVSGTEATIWLVSFGFKDNLMERIRACAEAQLRDMRQLRRPGVSITGLSLPVLEELADPNGACLRSYEDNLCAERIEAPLGDTRPMNFPRTL